MEQKKEIDLMVLAKLVWRRRKTIVVWACYGLLFGIMVNYSIPKEYTASVKVVSESSALSSGAMSSMGGVAAMMGINVVGASKSGIDEEVYPEIMRSSPFLWEFSSIDVPYKNKSIKLEEYVNEHEKKPWWSYVMGGPMHFVRWVFSSKSAQDSLKEKPVYTSIDPSPEQRLFEAKLAGRITMTKDKKTGVLEMSVKMQNPMVAAIVADSLTVKLQRYMTEYFTSKARSDLQSSTQQLVVARQNYYSSDSLYAVALDRNRNLIANSAKVMLDRLESERDLAMTIYKQLASQVEMNKLKLQENTPIVTVIEPSRVPGAPTSPRGMLIVVGFAFLGAFAAAMLVVFSVIKSK